jgi:2-methylcitrate dehydratase PrpD
VTQALTAPSPAPGKTSAAIADYVLSFHLSSQPAEVVRFGKHVLLDTLGCAIAGATTPSGRAAVAFARTSTSQEAHLAAPGQLVGAERAALANTICANALDHESVGPEGHLGAVAVPAALAVAERTNDSGAALLAATIAGLEVGGRVGAAWRRPSASKDGGAAGRGTPHGVIGSLPLVRGTPHAIFASVVPAAMLLGLDRETIRNAVGIAAYSAHVPTLRKAMESADPPMTKYDHLGGMAQAGIDAAGLAKSGLTGDTSAFEGDFGMWRFSGALDCDWSMIAAFGGDWLIAPTFFKTFPVVLYENPVLLAAREIVDANHLRPEEIEAIILRPAGLIPSQRGDGSGTSMAQWRSTAHGTAHAICGTRPFSAWQTGDPPPPSVRRLVELTTFEPYVAAEGEVKGTYFEGYSPVSVTIKARNASYDARITNLKRLTEADLVAKFIENVAPIAGAAGANELAEMILAVETLPRATMLLETLCKRH